MHAVKTLHVQPHPWERKVQRVPDSDLGRLLVLFEGTAYSEGLPSVGKFETFFSFTISKEAK